MRRASAARNVEAAHVGALLDGGILRIYGGVPPSDPDQLPFGDPLAELRFGTPAFHDPVDGVIDAYPLTLDRDARGDGFAYWFAAVQADETPVFDGLVGEEMKLDVAQIRPGARVTVRSVRYVAARS